MTTPSPKLIIGVDPGLSGAIAVVGVSSSGRVVPETATVCDMPLRREPGSSKDVVDLDALPCAARWLRDRRARFVMEHVGGRPGQSAPAAFQFGRAFGEVYAWAHGYYYGSDRVSLITPLQWQGFVGLGGEKDRKAASVALARTMFPNLHRDGMLPRSKDGRADALLIAVGYGRGAGILTVD